MIKTDKRKSILAERYSNDPASPYFVHYADCVLEGGDIKFAIDILEEGLKEKPNNAIGHFVLGKAYYQKKGFKDSRAELERAITLFPNLTNAYLLLIEISKREKTLHLLSSYVSKLKLIDPFYIAEDEKSIIKPSDTSKLESSFESIPSSEVSEMETVNIQDTSKEEKANTTFFDFEEIGETSLEKDKTKKHEEEKDDLDMELVVEEIFDNITKEVKEETKRNEPIIEKKDSDTAILDYTLTNELDIIKKEATKTASAKDSTRIISPTLGEIYLAQGKFTQARDIFKQLLSKNPESFKFKRKLNEIEKILDE